MLYFFLLEEGRSRRKSGILLGFFFFGIPVFFILLGLHAGKPFEIFAEERLRGKIQFIADLLYGQVS